MLVKLFQFYYSLLPNTLDEEVLKESSKNLFDVLFLFIGVVVDLHEEKKRKIKKEETLKQKEEKKGIFSFFSKKHQDATINSDIFEYEGLVMDTYFDFIKEHQNNTFIIYNFLLIAYLSDAVELFDDNIEYIESYFLIKFSSYAQYSSSPLEDKLFNLLIHIQLEWDKIKGGRNIHNLFRQTLKFSILAVKSIISYSFGFNDKKKRLDWMIGDHITFNYTNDINSQGYCNCTKELFEDIITLFNKASVKEDIIKVDSLIFSCFEEISKHPDSELFNIVFELKDRYNICYDYFFSKLNQLGLKNIERINAICSELEQFILPLLFYHKNPFIFYMIYIELKNSDNIIYIQTLFNNLIKGKILLMLVSNKYEGNLLLYNLINLIVFLEVLGRERKDILYKLIDFKFITLLLSPLTNSKYIYYRWLINTDYNDNSKTQPKKLICEFIFDLIINLYLEHPSYDILDLISTNFFENNKFSIAFQNLRNNTFKSPKELNSLKDFKTIFYYMDVKLIEQNKSKQKNTMLNFEDFLLLEKESISLFFLMKMFFIQSKNERDVKLDLYLNLMEKAICVNITLLYDQKSSFFKKTENQLYNKFKKAIETDFCKLGKKRTYEHLEKLLLKLQSLTENQLSTEGDKEEYIQTHPSYSCIVKKIKNVNSETLSSPSNSNGSSMSIPRTLSENNLLGDNKKYEVQQGDDSDDILFLAFSENEPDKYTFKKNPLLDIMSNSTDKKESKKEKKKNSDSGNSNMSKNKKEPTKIKKIKSFLDFEIDSNVFYAKKELILSVFSSVFKDIYFKNDAFSHLKAYYLSHFKVNRSGKQLKFPSKLRNFSNTVEPPKFLKQDFNFFKSKYFKVSHSYFSNLLPKIKIKQISLFPKLFPKIEYIVKFKCELIKYDTSLFGELIFYNNFIVFKNSESDLRKTNKYSDKLLYVFSSQEGDFIQKEKTLLFFYPQIEEVIIRRFIFMWQGIEIFIKDGKSFYFNFFSPEQCANFLSQLKKFYNGTIIENCKAYFEQQNYHNKWNDNEISNYDYLLLINKFTSRSYKELTQYPIFPWLINEYGNIMNIDDRVLLSPKLFSLQMVKSRIIEEEKKIKKYEKRLLRLFEYPISCQDEMQRRVTIEKYKDSKCTTNFPFGQGSHYSTSSFVFFYLMRFSPFNSSLIKLQNDHNENPNRMFISFEEIHKHLLDGGHDNRELIPEFFSIFEYMMNLNCCYYGFRIHDEIVDDLHFFINNNKNFSLKIYANFLIQHRKLLNSRIVYNKINTWIDWVFGVNQITNKAETCNTFSKTVYEEKVNLRKKLEKKRKTKNDMELYIFMINKISIVLNFGQAPHQLFSHEITKKEYELQVSSGMEFIESWASCWMTRTFSISIDDMCFFFNLTSDEKILYIINDFGKRRIVHFYETLFSENSTSIEEVNYFGFKKLSNTMKMLPNKLLQENKIKDKGYIFSRSPEYRVIDMKSGEYLISGNYVDNSFKIQSSFIKKKENDYSNIHSVLVEDYVQSIAKIDNENFVIGLRNGKLIKFKFNVNDNNKNNINNSTPFELIEEQSLFDHDDAIKIILIDNRLNIIITYGEDDIINIRKLYDFELLSYIVLNDIEVICIKISDANLLYVLCYEKKRFKSMILGFTLNGIFFAKRIENRQINSMDITSSGNVLISYNNSKIITVLKGSDLEIKGEVDIEDLIQKNGGEKINKGVYNEVTTHIISFKFIKNKQYYIIAQTNDNQLLTIQLTDFDSIVLFS